MKVHPVERQSMGHLVLYNARWNVHGADITIFLQWRTWSKLFLLNQSTSYLIDPRIRPTLVSHHGYRTSSCHTTYAPSAWPSPNFWLLHSRVVPAVLPRHCIWIFVVDWEATQAPQDLHLYRIWFEHWGICINQTMLRWCKEGLFDLPWLISNWTYIKSSFVWLSVRPIKHFCRKMDGSDTWCAYRRNCISIMVDEQRQ